MPCIHFSPNLTYWKEKNLSSIFLFLSSPQDIGGDIPGSDEDATECPSGNTGCFLSGGRGGGWRGGRQSCLNQLLTGQQLANSEGGWAVKNTLYV